MQVALPGYNCPYFQEGDVLSLSSDFSVSADVLQDIPLVVTHELHGPAAKILMYLQRGIVYSSLVKRIETLNVPDTALTELLGFLNTCGALVRTRSKLRTFQSMIEQILLFLRTGVRYPVLTYRRQFQKQALLVSVIRTSMPVLVSSLLVGFLFSLGLGTSLQKMIITVVGGLTLLVISTYVHEYAHYVFIARAKLSVAIVRRGMRLGLIHQTASLPVRSEIYSALAGPLAGTYICLGVVLTTALIDMPWLALISACIAFLHGCSLLPWYGDGKSIKDAWHRKDQNHETK